MTPPAKRDSGGGTKASSIKIIIKIGWFASMEVGENIIQIELTIVNLTNTN